MSAKNWTLVTIAALAVGTAMPAAAQDSLDRADPALLEGQLDDAELHKVRAGTPDPIVAPVATRDPAPAPVAAPPAAPIAVPAPASVPAAAPAPVPGQIVIGAIRVEGASQIPPEAFASVIAANAGRSVSQAELRQLAGDIAGVARARGYGLATAWIPQQQVRNGVLHVQLDEGRIDAVRVDGAGAATVERYLAPLVGGRPVRTAALERQLLLAGDAAGIRVGKARLEREDGRNILVVSSRRTAVEGRAALDNWGSSSVGPVRAHLAVDVNGVAADDDQFSLGGAITPLDPSEFHLVRAEYTRPVGTGGTEVNLGGYYARSKPSVSRRDYEGRSYEVSLGVDHAFVRRRSASAWGYLTLAVRDSESEAGALRLRNDRIATLTASSYAYVRLGEGRLRGRVSLVQGVDLFDATRDGDPLASRDDGSALFTKLEGWAGYTAPLGGPLSLSLEARGQIASRPLLSSEEMGLGGRSFLRGYDYREVSGDKGVVGAAELRFDLGKLGGRVKAAEAFVYGDAGSVGNYEGDRGGGSLASVGGGVRIGVGRIQAGLELGFPLADGYDGRDRDPRLSFTIGTRF